MLTGEQLEIRGLREEVKRLTKEKEIGSVLPEMAGLYIPIAAFYTQVRFIRPY
jgi:hypothetical protein